MFNILEHPDSAVPALVLRGRYKGPAQHLCGGVVLSSPGDVPANPPANTTLNTHAGHPAWCLFAYLGCRSQSNNRRWRFMYLYTRYPTGTPHRVVDARGPSGRSGSGVTRYAADHHEKASMMSSPGAPELQNVTEGQSLFLRSPIRMWLGTALIKLSSTMCDWAPKFCVYLIIKIETLDHESESNM